MVNRSKADQQRERRKSNSLDKKAKDLRSNSVTRYEVNPDRNNGVNFAYDEVVRNKEERKRMEATDGTF